MTVYPTVERADADDEEAECIIRVGEIFVQPGPDGSVLGWRTPWS